MKLRTWLVFAVMHLSALCYASPSLPDISGDFSVQQIIPTQKIKIAMVYLNTPGGTSCLHALQTNGFSCELVSPDNLNFIDQVSTQTRGRSYFGLYKCVRHEHLDAVPASVMQQVNEVYANDKLEFGQVRGQPQRALLDPGEGSWWVPQLVTFGGETFHRYKYIRSAQYETIEVENSRTGQTQKFFLQDGISNPSVLRTTEVREERASLEEVKGTLSVTDKYLIEIVFQKQNQ